MTGYQLWGCGATKPKAGGSKNIPLLKSVGGGGAERVLGILKGWGGTTGSREVSTQDLEVLPN